MKFVPTELPGVVMVEPDVYRDGRGFFLESYHVRKYREAGIDAVFVQDNHSHSSRGILRGLHLQTRRPQGKLVRVVTGEVFDVAVDVRVGSPSFTRFVGVRLSADDQRQLYVPPGFAHGFVVLSEEADFEYKCTDFYDPGGELSIAWNDPDIGIPWPIESPSLSSRDAAAPRLAELTEQLPRYGG